MKAILILWPADLHNYMLCPSVCSVFVLLFFLLILNLPSNAVTHFDQLVLFLEVLCSYI